MSLEKKYPANIVERIENCSIIDQKYYKFIKELNSYSEEQLDTIAIIDKDRKYSYRRMFRDWENYASVFSALGITAENGSRLGFVPWQSYETICAFYGINMTGAGLSVLHELDILDTKRWDALIEKEGITDILVSRQALETIHTNRKVVNNALDSCERLGIKKLIILDTTDGGSGRVRDRGLRKWAEKYDFVFFMSDLMDKYQGTPVSCETDESNYPAVIVHTSGTTSGIHKPIPMSDKAFNESAARLLRDERFNSLKKVVTVMTLSITSSYGMCDMLHLPLSYGGTIILADYSKPDIKLIRLLEKERPTVLFAIPGLLELFIMLGIYPDLSSLKFVFLGGAYVSPESKRDINRYLRRCGSTAKVSVGYGVSEIGAAALLADSEDTRDTIGDPLPGVKIKIYDEMEEQYYDLSTGSHTGVMFLSSESLSDGRIGDEIFFELEEIDGEKYVNTYDLVELDSDGSLRIIGRMNKFFVNNEGVRFDAGLVETAVSSQSGIECCGLAPEYSKLIHDTVPVLYVQIKSGVYDSIRIVREALYNVFIEDNRIVDTNLPSKVVITKSIPLTKTGKVDVYAIQKNNVKGSHYSVEGIRINGKLTDIVMKKLNLTDYKGVTEYDGSVPDELENDVKIFRGLLKASTPEEFFNGEIPVPKMPKDCFDPVQMKKFFEGMMNYKGHPDHRCTGEPDPYEMMFVIMNLLGFIAHNMEHARYINLLYHAPISRAMIHRRHRPQTPVAISPVIIPLPCFDEYWYDCPDDECGDEYEDDDDRRPKLRHRPYKPFGRRPPRPPFPWFDDYYDEEEEDKCHREYDDDEDDCRPKLRHRPYKPCSGRPPRPPFPWFDDYCDEEEEDKCDREYDDDEDDRRSKRRHRPYKPFGGRPPRPPFPWFYDYDDEDEDEEKSSREYDDDYDDCRPKRRRRPYKPFGYRPPRPPFPWFDEYEEDDENNTRHNEENPFHDLIRLFRPLFNASEYDEFYEE